MRVLSVIGSRPEIIQAAPLSTALEGQVEEVLVHTGQHYDPSMSDLQMTSVRLRSPDWNLCVGSLPDLQQLELTERRLGEVIDRERPDGVIVRGDTNATLGGARAAVARSVPLLHVEAGLRSYRKEMPEERNRVETDHVSDVLFAPTERARKTLLLEGARGTIHLTGDPLADVLMSMRERLPSGHERGDYVLATIHRNYNTDDPERLERVLACLAACPLRVVLPLHPRTAAALEATGLELPRNVHAWAPVPYLDMLVLERDAVAIATDSGGVQREAYLWGVPCITLREETEWLETVDCGWNTLVGADPERFRAAFELPTPDARPPLFGDGRASEHTAELAITYLEAGAEEATALA